MSTAPSIAIRPAREGEAELLREIAVASKNHWDYGLERVRAWADGWDLERVLREEQVYVAEAGGEAAGWAALIPREEIWWLDDLWILPAWIGRGVGRALFRHCAELARGAGAARLEWESDPNAVGFYERMGGRYVRDSEATEWGRILPVMALELASSSAKPA